MPMMGGPGIFAMMSWMLLGTLLFIVLAVFIVWFLVHKLNTREHVPYRYMPHNQEMSQTYEQGYRPETLAPNTSQERVKSYQTTHDEQPQAQYPQEQSMPEQH